MYLLYNNTFDGVEQLLASDALKTEGKAILGLVKKLIVFKTNSAVIQEVFYWERFQDLLLNNLFKNLLIGSHGM